MCCSKIVRHKSSKEKWKVCIAKRLKIFIVKFIIKIITFFLFIYYNKIGEFILTEFIFKTFNELENKI